MTSAELHCNGNHGHVAEESEASPSDPWCDPNRPKTITFQDISAAAYRIKGGIIKTPCLLSHMSTLTKMEIYFKKDFLQYTGSFKERGARNTLLMLSNEQRRVGVVTASAGNHALALSFHGRSLGIPVTVVMPIIAPIMKLQLCRQNEATVVVSGANLAEWRIPIAALEHTKIAYSVPIASRAGMEHSTCSVEKSKDHAMTIAKNTGMTYINGYDHPHILAGQGTLGLEILDQVPDVDAVVVPIGGGGLIAGVALAIKSLRPNVQIIGAEPEHCASFAAALAAGGPVPVKIESTLADGLAVPTVGVNAFATAAPLVDKIVTVKEEMIAIAILRLVELEKAVVEGAGAVALAAVLHDRLPELEGKRVVIPLCGGNIDTTVLGRCLERGLAVDGRLVKLTVTVSDRPGGIAELTRFIAQAGVSIKDIIHERAWISTDIFSVEVKVVCETRDRAHAEELETRLRSHYKHVRCS